MIGVDIEDHQLAAGAHLVHVAGDVDLYAAPDLREHIERAASRGTACLIVELADGTVIDSTILGVLLAALKRLGLRGASLRIVCADPKLLRIFTITGLDRRFEIHASVADALRAHEAAAPPAL